MSCSDNATTALDASFKEPKKVGLLEGLVNLVDDIQDRAADEYGYGEEEVFGKK